MDSIRENLKSDVKEICCNTSDFGEAATFTPSGGTAKEITGIFRDGQKEVPLTGTETVMTEPEFQCSQEDVTSAKHGDTLYIASQLKTWFVLYGRKKTNGSFVLYLAESLT